jgi:hypothetical protein
MLLADLGATVIRVDRKVPSGLGARARSTWALQPQVDPRGSQDPAGVALCSTSSRRPMR